MDTQNSDDLLTKETIDVSLFRKLPREMVKRIKEINQNATQHTVFTRSLYVGIWVDSLQCMDGHGVYTFPDESVYTGYFQRGHFHGYGTIHLAAPYGFSFKGTFIKGELEEIDEMWFDDGLGVDASIDGWDVDFTNWKYCTNNDRRYAEEQREGIQPVGPFSLLTPQSKPRELPRNSYDVGEGIYSPVTSIITQRPPPFPNCHFVTCKKDMDWIIKNCRVDGKSPLVIPPEVCHKIIRNNLNSEMEIGEHVPTCNHDQDKNRRRYFAKLCPEYGRTTADSDGSVGSQLSNESSSCRSFTESSISVDIEELLFMVHQYDQYKFGRDLTQESAVSIRAKKE